MSATPTVWGSSEPTQGEKEHKDSNSIVRATAEDPPSPKPTVDENPKPIECFSTYVKAEHSVEEGLHMRELHEAQEKISRLAARVAELEMEKENEKVTQEQIDTLQHQLDVAERKIEELTEERDNLKAQVANLQQHLHELNIRKSPSHTQEPDRKLLTPLTVDVHVKEIGCSLGSGAFGTVKEVSLEDGKRCAGKVFRRDVRVTSQEVCKKFLTEYHILKDLDHDHIVRYYGCALFDSGDSDLPLLLMELLSTSLYGYYFGKDCSSHIDLHTKFTILLGVAKGLAYLHFKGVIHRDLHANNVLLQLDGRSMVTLAKISDFGNSRITGQHISSQLESITPFPSILHYMPPEASSGKYTFKLDMFSYGHLALLVVIKDPMKQLKPVKVSDSGVPGGYCKALMEVDRRQSYIAKMFTYLGDDHILVEVVKQCLSDKPDLRPSAESVIDRFTAVRVDQISSVHIDNDTAIAPEQVQRSDSNSYPDIN